MGRHDARVADSAVCATCRPAPGKGPRRPEEAGAVKKGFLGGGGGASTKKAAAAERPDLTVVRKAEGADPLRLADVQKSMDEQAASSSAAKVGGGGAPEWVTPALLQQIASDPLLRKAFTDPKCAAAMAALQQDPKKAMETYKDVPEMKEFLVKFMGLMGEHFTALADAAPPAAAPVQPVTPVQPVSEEEQRVHKAMQDPEVVAILKDAEVQSVLQRLQMGKAHEVERSMTRPDMVRKLQKLSQAGLIGMHWER